VDKALENLIESSVGNGPRRALVVYDDRMNHHACNMMSATSAFLAEASKTIIPGQECICIPKSAYVKNKERIDTDRLDVIADLCLESTIEKALISIDDFTIDVSAGLDDPDIEFVGNVPDPIMNVLGVMDIQEALLTSYFHAIGVEERLDLPARFDALSAMSFGRSSLDAAYLDWDAKTESPYWPLIWDFVLAETYKDLPAYAPYAATIKEIEDLNSIWEHFQEEEHIGIRIGRHTEHELPSVDEVITSMNRVAHLVGIDTAVEAYYSGVPASDIIA
jgi:hypothetical protein